MTKDKVEALLNLWNDLDGAIRNIGTAMPSRLGERVAQAEELRNRFGILLRDAALKEWQQLAEKGEVP